MSQVVAAGTEIAVGVNAGINRQMFKKAESGRQRNLGQQGMRPAGRAADISLSETGHTGSLRIDGDCDTLRIWGHYNKDRLNYDDSNYAMATSLRWHNLLGGVKPVTPAL